MIFYLGTAGLYFIAKSGSLILSRGLKPFSLCKVVFEVLVTSQSFLYIYSGRKHPLLINWNKYISLTGV